MLDRDRIENEARKAAVVAHTVLGLSHEYSVILIDDPSVPEDARFDTTKNEIQINLDRLKPFSVDEAGTGRIDLSEEDKLIDENYRHLLKICYLVFHEMRHLYQKEAVLIYTINKKLGGHSLPPLESDKKAALWLEEMKDENIPPEEQDIEADANDFAYYLTNRYPIQLPMARTNKRIGAMKRKYDKIPIPDV